MIRGLQRAEDRLTPEHDPLIVALSLARHAAWPVFPIDLEPSHIRPGAVDKRPLIRWLEGATTDPEEIATLWGSTFPGAWVGVHAERAGIDVVDIDLPKHGDGRDGLASLKARGLVLPKTFRYPTRSGGKHHVYRAPQSRTLTIARDVEVDGVKVPGVDIRAGHGLMVYYGPELTEAPVLADAPEWALVDGARMERRDGDTDAWIGSLRSGKPDAAVKAAGKAVSPTGMAHDEMLEAVAQLVRLGADGHPGVPDALDQARSTYLVDYPDYARHWDNAVSGSIGRFGFPLTTITLTPAQAEKRLAREAARSSLVVDYLQKVEAKRRAQAEGAGGASATPHELRQEAEGDKKGKKKHKGDPAPARRKAATELMGKEFAPLDWVVPGLISEGTSLLSAAPKIGKSLLALEVAHAVATGGQALGNIPVGAPRPVLYIDLESGERRLQQRLAALPGGGAELGLLEYHLDAETAREEFSRFMLDHVGERPLVVVDTLAAILEDKPADRSILKHEHSQMATFQQITNADPGAAVIIVHHTNKGAGADPMQAASGSHGITGGVDSPMFLTRDRHATTGVLRCLPRDWEGGEYAVDFTDGRWRLTGGSLVSASQAAASVADQARAARLGPVKQALIDILQAAGEDGVEMESLARQYAGVTGNQPGRLRQNLSELADKGLAHSLGLSHWAYGPADALTTIRRKAAS